MRAVCTMVATNTGRSLRSQCARCSRGALRTGTAALARRSTSTTSLPPRSTTTKRVGCGSMAACWMAAGPSTAKRRRSQTSTSVMISACGGTAPSSASARVGASGSSGSMRATSAAASGSTARTAWIAPIGPRPKLRRGTAMRSSSGCEAARRGECSSPVRTSLKRWSALRRRIEVRTPSFTSRRTSSPSRVGRRSHQRRAGRSPRARSASATSRMSGATESGRGSSTTASSQRVRKRSRSASSMGFVQPRSRTGTRPSRPNSPRM